MVGGGDKQASAGCVCVGANNGANGVVCVIWEKKVSNFNVTRQPFDFEISQLYCLIS